MATVTLSVSHPILNLYRPYPFYNHHHTQIGFNCQMLGDSLTILPKDIYFYVRQGNWNTSLPPNITGTATSATSTRLSDTSKNFLSSDNSWLGNGGNWVTITGGTGAGQTREVAYTGANYIDVATWTTTPDATSTYCIAPQWLRVRSEFEDKIPNLYLQHDEYTIWTMVFDSGGIPRVARNYMNINTLLAAAPPVINSVSPQIIFKKEDIVGGMSHVKVRARQGDTVKLYWRYAMDEGTLIGLYPGIQDGTADHGSGIVFTKRRILSFVGTPIASGVATDASGEIQFDIPATTIPSVSGERWVVASAQHPGANYGESFSCAAVKVFQQTGPPYTADAEDMRQSKIIFTPTTTTRNTNGVLEKFYTIDVKNVGLYTGAISDYSSLSEFYYNENNNGNAYNVPVSTGVWVPVGTTKTLLIVDTNANGSTAGTPYTYWSTHIIDAGAPTPATKTAYTSLADAITRGPNALMPKDEVGWYSVAWDIGTTSANKVYINNNPDDTTTAPAGFYFVPSMSMAIQMDSTGLIIGRQYVGGVATY